MMHYPPFKEMRHQHYLRTVVYGRLARIRFIWIKMMAPGLVISSVSAYAQHSGTPLFSVVADTLMAGFQIGIIIAAYSAVCAIRKARYDERKMLFDERQLERLLFEAGVRYRGSFAQYLRDRNAVLEELHRRGLLHDGHDIIEGSIAGN